MGCVFGGLVWGMICGNGGIIHSGRHRSPSSQDDHERRCGRLACKRLQVRGTL